MHTGKFAHGYLPETLCCTQVKQLFAFHYAVRLCPGTQQHLFSRYILSCAISVTLVTVVKNY